MFLFEKAPDMKKKKKSWMMKEKEYLKSLWFRKTIDCNDLFYGSDNKKRLNYNFNAFKTLINIYQSMLSGRMTINAANLWQKN